MTNRRLRSVAGPIFAIAAGLLLATGGPWWSAVLMGVLMFAAFQVSPESEEGESDGEEKEG